MRIYITDSSIQISLDNVDKRRWTQCNLNGLDCRLKIQLIESIFMRFSPAALSSIDSE